MHLSPGRGDAQGSGFWALVKEGMEGGAQGANVEEREESKEGEVWQELACSQELWRLHMFNSLRISRIGLGDKAK